MSEWKNYLLSFLGGAVLTLGAAYISFPKNLVTKDYLDERLTQIENHIKNTDTNIETNRQREEQDAYQLGRVQERLRMAQ
jgi:hypothetical protein